MSILVKMAPQPPGQGAALATAVLAASASDRRRQARQNKTRTAGRWITKEEVASEEVAGAVTVLRQAPHRPR